MVVTSSKSDIQVEGLSAATQMHLLSLHSEILTPVQEMRGQPSSPSPATLSSLPCRQNLVSLHLMRVSFVSQTHDYVPTNLGSHSATHPLCIYLNSLSLRCFIWFSTRRLWLTFHPWCENSATSSSRLPAPLPQADWLS